MSSSQKFSFKKFFALSLFVLLLLYLPSLLGYAILSAQCKNLNLKAEGNFVPRIGGSFDLNQAKIDWDDRVELISGDLHFHFDSFSLVSPQPLRFAVSGENLQVRLKGEWKTYQDVSEAELETFQADFGLGKDGIEAIYSVEAFGPKFQFSIRETEK